MMLTVGSLFSGIGGFDRAFHQAGFRLAWMCEIEPFPRKVLARRFPGVPCYDDVTTLRGAAVEPVDVLVGGFPCQDLSVAGKRAGLSGGRSGLFFEFMRLADELKPEWLVIENVPGLLSSHRGADFAVVVNALVELGYGVAWRVLDSQFFGVAQRRRRVFLVACAGGQRNRAQAVLFESEGGGGHHAAGEEAGARVVACLRGRSHGVGVNMPGRGGEDDQNLVTIAPTPDTMENGQLIGQLVSGNQGSGGNKSWLGSDEPHQTLTVQHKPNAICIAPTLDQSLGHHRGSMGVGAIGHPATGVRLLTPLECERLQAFPDGWTCLCGCEPYSTAACTCPDSPRYRALGNAVTVSTVQWIAERMAAA